MTRLTTAIQVFRSTCRRSCEFIGHCHSLSFFESIVSHRSGAGSTHHFWGLRGPPALDGELRRGQVLYRSADALEERDRLGVGATGRQPPDQFAELTLDIRQLDNAGG